MKTCKECQFEMVHINRTLLKEIANTFRPVFSGLPEKWQSSKSEWQTICPRCNAYALGIDLKESFPIQRQNGDNITIHDLEYSLWEHE